jgi:hypothetical protein
MLTHTIRFKYQPTMKVNIHNQCPYFHLMDGRFFSIGIKWDRYPDERIYADGMMSIDLIPLLSIFDGIVTYELERKNVRSTYIRLFVAWKSEGYKKFQVFLHLIEYGKQYVWSKAKLEEYYQRYASQLYTYTYPIIDTWLMPDGTVLKTKLELDFTQRDGVLSVNISEGIRDERTRRPEWFNLKR